MSVPFAVAFSNFQADKAILSVVESETGSFFEQLICNNATIKRP
jgi:hypothetical protein